MKKIFSLITFISLLFTSCTQDLSEFDNSLNNTNSFQIKLADFLVNGNPSSLPEEDAVEDMQAYLFVEGQLTKKYENLPVSGKLNLVVAEKEGNLYVVANGKKYQIDAMVGESSEAEWLKKTTAVKEDATVNDAMFFVGVEDVSKLWSEKNSSITLKRGLARFDVSGLSESVKLKSLAFENTADRGYFFPQATVQTPEDARKVTLNFGFDTPLTENKKGAAYMYEQISDGLSVKISLEVNGTPKEVTTSLKSIPYIKRNAVYTLQLGETSSGISVDVSVDEWENGGNTILPPSYQSEIKIDANTSDIMGADIVNEGYGLLYSHQASTSILSLACDNELELLSVDSKLVTVTPNQDEFGKVIKNQFKIEKKQLPPGGDTTSVVLYFKRKGLNNAYSKDKITLSFKENPTKLTGDLHFDAETATCDFETYVENELGVFEVEEGKKVEAVVEGGEDPWLLVKPVPEAPRTFRVLAGWKPNDPKADGRVQEAKIRIVNKEAASTEKQLGVETYTVRRRTKKADLPVVNINGTWWCKYNLRGDATNIYDQILTTNDPANGQDVVSYIQSLQNDDFLAVLGGQYQGGRTEALPLKYDTEAKGFYYEGYSGSAQDFGTLPDTAMVPSGYRLPHKEDYIFFTSKSSQEDFNLGGSGKTQNYVNKFDKNVSVHIYAKENVSFCGGTYGTINYFEFNYDGQKLVLCGLGHQWEPGVGKIAFLNILLATSGEERRTWNIEGYTWEQKPKGENWLKYPVHNAPKTRTIRCIKKEVPEYIY